MIEPDSAGPWGGQGGHVAEQVLWRAARIEPRERQAFLVARFDDLTPQPANESADGVGTAAV